MNPPKLNRTFERPLYMFDPAATPSADSASQSYIAPEAVADPVPFAVSSAVRLPYLYHAGTAFSLFGSGGPSVPTADVDFSSNGPLYAYQAHPTARAWGVAGRRLRVPRSVVILAENVGSEAEAASLLALIGPTAATAGASVVIANPSNGRSALTAWAPRNLDAADLGTPTANSPVPAATWLAGELLAIVNTATVYFGNCALSGSDPTMAAYASAGWEVFPAHHGSEPVSGAIAIDRTGIAAARGHWTTLMARVGRFKGYNLYDPFQGTDAPFPQPDTIRVADWEAAYSSAALWADVTGSLTPTWTRTSVMNLRQSPTNGATEINAAIAAFWP